MPTSFLGTALKTRARGEHLPRPAIQIKSTLQLKGLIAWCAIASALFAYNLWSLTRGPTFDNSSDPQTTQQIRLAQSESGVSPSNSGFGHGDRAPAALGGATLLNDVMTETELPCSISPETAPRLSLGPQVRQLRFLFGECAGDVKSIRNQSNGFEATIFEGAGSDYISLTSEQNVLRVETSKLAYEIKVERALP